MCIHALVCVYIHSVYIGEYVHSCTVCVCVCLFTNGLCSSSECLIPACVGGFLFRLMQSGEVSASTAAGYQ